LGVLSTELDAATLEGKIEEATAGVEEAAAGVEEAAAGVEEAATGVEEAAAGVDATPLLAVQKPR
jgi:X-X-X-Leu-X-X-Gly heptad repeat protein